MQKSCNVIRTFQGVEFWRFRSWKILFLMTGGIHLSSLTLTRSSLLIIISAELSKREREELCKSEKCEFFHFISGFQANSPRGIILSFFASPGALHLIDCFSSKSLFYFFGFKPGLYPDFLSRYSFFPPGWNLQPQLVINLFSHACVATF